MMWPGERMPPSAMHGMPNCRANRDTCPRPAAVHYLILYRHPCGVACDADPQQSCVDKAAASNGLQVPSTHAASAAAVESRKAEDQPRSAPT